jgi:UDP-N-acetylglucosamine--N-acetylmuramyl-(pentapeptide) pyrophosphoryl-undecaprenol N-acetylglucosamine transferase
MAVTEICVTGKAAIFVPFPFAAEDHQTHNALQLVNQEAAYLVKDKDAKTLLVQTAIQLAQDKDKRKLFAENCQKLAIKNADNIIAEQILINS